MGVWHYVYLRKYIKDDSVWICPNPRSLYCERYAYGFRCSWLPRNSNNFLDGDTGFCDDNGVGRTIEDVERLDATSNNTACGPRSMPAHKKIMWMCYAIGEWGNGMLGNGSYPWIFPCYAHEDGSNYAYADGHVAWQKMGKGWAPIGYTTTAIDGAPSGNYANALTLCITDRARKISQQGGANR